MCVCFKYDERRSSNCEHGVVQDWGSKTCVLSKHFIHRPHFFGRIESDMGNLIRKDAADIVFHRKSWNNFLLKFIIVRLRLLELGFLLFLLLDGHHN